MPSTDKNVKPLCTSFTASEYARRDSHSGKQKVFFIEVYPYPYDSTFPLLGIYLDKLELVAQSL